MALLVGLIGSKMVGKGFMFNYYDVHDERYPRGWRAPAAWLVQYAVEDVRRSERLWRKRRYSAFSLIPSVASSYLSAHNVDV